MNSDEVNVINGLKCGNEKAYFILYKDYYKSLCIYACEFVEEDFVAETIVSDVIFSIWQNREKLKIDKSLKNYLIKSVKNRCINYLYQMEKQAALRKYVGEAIERKQAAYESDTDNPLYGLIEKDINLKVNESINSLPPLTKKIFCMSRFKNLKYEEIALELNVSIDVVKYHIKSALFRLKTDLKEFLK